MSRVTVEGEFPHIQTRESSFGSWLPTIAIFAAGLGIAGLIVVGACEAQAAQSRNYTEGMKSYLAAQLKGQIPLNPTEKLYPKVEVVPAGNSLAEAIAMKRSGQMVNVREYPGTVLPNGVETKVIGRISQKQTLDNVLLTPGAMPNSPVMGFWGAFDCSENTQNGAKIIWDSAFSTAEGFRVCVVYEDFLSAVK